MDAYRGTIPHHLHLIWQSFRNLPLWLQGWVCLVLMPLNGTSLLLLDSFSGLSTALALLMILSVNLPLMWHHRGLNNDMSLVHLFAWIPLEVALLGQLTGNWGDDHLAPIVWGFTLTVFIVNAISLFCDVIDAWCWAQGDRVTLHPAANEW